MRAAAALLSREARVALECAATAWVDHGDLDGHLAGMAEQDAMCLHNFFIARGFTQRFTVHPLPARVAEAQAVAVCRRFADHLCLAKPAHRELAAQWASAMRVCVVCSTVRNFVADDEPKPLPGKRAPKKTGVGAIGFNGCVHSAQTGRISCKGTSSAGERTEMCRAAHLVETQLLRFESGDEGDRPIACFARFQGAEYMLSPCCGFVCIRGSVRAKPDGTWSCPRCVGEQNAARKQECVFCRKVFARSGALKVVALTDENGEAAQFRFCKQHTKEWFDDSLGITEVLDRLATQDTKKRT